MEVLNGKWKIGLIWCIHSGIVRPGELHRRLPKASRRLLDIQLNQLNAHGILNKTVYDEKVPRVAYSLTKLGESLIPIIEATASWGESHRKELEPLIQVD